ncbi:MAG: hypothetical protein COA79_16325 [Planctomycetota bacterium]|nr:MAG: hypothetical protein COA79_16325 [Planctomycetota bacterium]
MEKLKSSEFTFDRSIPDSIYENALDQFPKLCKKCHKVYYDFSDWFAEDNLGTPKRFKGTKLLFLRACRCRNTLAVAMDFEKVLKEDDSNDDIFLSEIRNLFIAEMPLWRNKNCPKQINRNLMTNIDDSKHLEKILKLDPGKILENEHGSYFQFKIPRWQNVKLYVCRGTDCLHQTITKCLNNHENIACGIFYLKHDNIQPLLKVIDSIKSFDANFQSITFSEELQSVTEFGLDNNYHNQLNENDESVPFMIINRLNCYYSLQ